MKKIEIIGGMGSIATAHFFKRVVEKCVEKFNARNDDDFPEIIVINVPFAGTSEKRIEDKEKVFPQLMEAVEKIRNAGAEILAIPCNTLHIFAKEINHKIKLVNMIEKAVERIKESEAVAVLASETSEKENLYLRHIKHVINLSENEREKINKVIKLVMENKKREGRTLLKEIIEEVRKKGAKKVIIGCTELSVVTEHSPDIVDALEVLAEEVLREAYREKRK